MRLLVIGLDGLPADLLLAQDALPSIGRLMEAGWYGRLAGVDPPTSVPSWLCMATSRDPGSLGVYGAWPAGSVSRVDAATIGDEVTRGGGRSVVVSMPGVEAPASGAASFQSVRDRLRLGEWDCLHYVDETIRRGGESDDARIETLRGLDAELAETLELLDGETAVLVVSQDVAVPVDQPTLSEWLVGEGLLTRANADADWSRTTCWSEGECCVYLNVKGRDPFGTIEPADLERVRDDVAARLRARTGADGRPLGIEALRPQDVYREVRGRAPDLVVRSAAPRGAFVLAGPNGLTAQEIEGAHLLDLAPTLLEVGGIEVPSTMQGTSLLARASTRADAAAMPSEEELIRDHLRGLGYL